MMKPSMPPGPVSGPSVWRGADLAKQPEQWIRRFSAAELAELDAAIGAFKASGAELGGIAPAGFCGDGMRARRNNHRDQAPSEDSL